MVLVTGTGRCGTVTFYQACRHMTNYTVGHETGLSPFADVGRIEIDPRFAGDMPRLMEAYPDAKWVHLTRERDAAVQSLAQECPSRVTKYADLWSPRLLTTLQAAAFYYDSVNAQIATLLPAQALTIGIEDIAAWWRQFWDWIRAEGDFEASLKTFKRRYNAGGHRGRENFIEIAQHAGDPASWREIQF